MATKRVAKAKMNFVQTTNSPEPIALNNDKKTIPIYPIKSASYSRLLDFETCPLRAKLKHVDRIPEEKSEAADRGTAIHQLAEDFVGGKIKSLPPELRKFSDEFLALRERFKEKKVSLEGDWGFDRDWAVTSWKDAWMRIKLDARVSLSKKHSVVVDYKTGKRFGNEVKHGEQVALYGLAELLREPDVEQVTVELWYLDIDDMVSTLFSREQLFRHLPQFEKRLKKMTTATEFPANPNVFSCKWCPYGPAKGGQCEFGVLPGDTAISQYRRKYG